MAKAPKKTDEKQEPAESTVSSVKLLTTLQIKGEIHLKGVVLELPELFAQELEEQGLVALLGESGDGQ